MSKEELPPQFNPDTTQQAQGMMKQLTTDVVRDFGKFMIEGAQTMGSLELINQDQVDEITSAAIDQYEWNQRVRASVANQVIMSDIQINTAVDVVNRAIPGGHGLIETVSQLQAEAIDFSKLGSDFMPDPETLHGRLLDQGKSPYRSTAILYLLAHNTLLHTRNIVDYSAYTIVKRSIDTILTSLKPQVATAEKGPRFEVENDLKVIFDTPKANKYTLENAEALLKVLAVSAKGREIGSAGLVQPVVLAYRGWQQAQKAMPEDGIQAYRIRMDPSTPQPFKRSSPIKPPVKPAAELIEEREAELATLLEQHKTHAAGFRPSWNQLQKAGFRTLSNKLQMTSELGSNIPSKRLTSLLTVLARSGQISDYGESRIRQILADEQRLESRITTLFADLQINKRDRGERWQPVADDLALLAHNWDTIKPHVVYLWPKDGAAAAASIKVSLDVFQKVKQELEQVESASQSEGKE